MSGVSSISKETSIVMSSENVSQIVQTETFCPASQQEWRQWLKKNHKSKQSIWLILYKKESGKPIIGWSGAVDEALCFGWVDSKRKPVDREKFMQFFSRRKLKGTWSKVNKEKVRQLIVNRRMTKAGLECIETAKQIARLSSSKVSLNYCLNFLHSLGWKIHLPNR